MSAGNTINYDFLEKMYSRMFEWRRLAATAQTPAETHEAESMLATLRCSIRDYVDAHTPKEES